MARGKNERPALEAVILDFDGLIADTETLHYQSWRAEAELLGQTLDKEAFAAVVGWNLTDEEVVRTLLGPEYVGCTAVIASRARRRRNQRRHMVDLLPGALDFIRAVEPDGLLLGLATSSPRERVLGLLERFDILARFQATCYGDEVREPKPAPDVYLAVLERLGIEPGYAVALEDSENGARAAAAAGLRCVAVPQVMTRMHDFSFCQLTLPSLVTWSPRRLADVLDMPIRAHAHLARN
jgi:putative hydrolase of the HAD superfamily